MTKIPRIAPNPSPKANLDPWNRDVCLTLLQQLWRLRKTLQDSELRFEKTIRKIGAGQQRSARNLAHYLAFRATDLRALQDKLAWLGVSSLGRAESHVMANLDKVIGILHRLTDQSWHDLSGEEPCGSVSGTLLLRDHAEALLGPPLPSRRVRIMVTLGTEAAKDYNLVKGLVDAGMEIARINCAHDDAIAWKAMAALVRKAAKAAKREVKILMDLGGPKVRTGPVEAGPKVLKLKPKRDVLGVVSSPSRLWIGLVAQAPSGLQCSGAVSIDPAWLARLRVDNVVRLTDARGKKRSLQVVQANAQGVVVECGQTFYLTPEVALIARRPRGHKPITSYPGGIEAVPGILRLHRGERLLLTLQGEGGNLPQAHIACTMPLVFEQVRAGERIWFDDGRIGGVVRRADSEGMEIEIVQSRDAGENLAADKGINFPDSQLDLPALTEKDLEDLQTVAEVADMVGLSFVHDPAEIHRLLGELKRVKRQDMGLILKIETLRGFANLPALMLAAMAAPCAGVMIARGDLAVECGFERMAEIQEEILCCAEAAHMPVIWATQVLETLGKTGIPSRAEISDASMGERAECVMLNKGPFVTEAVVALGNILERMAGHQDKKTPLLRALRAWGESDGPFLS